MVTPEAHPFAKTGGLAEVASALPAALARLGHRVTIVLPRYRGVDDGGIAFTHSFNLGAAIVHVRFIERHLADGVTAVLVDAPGLFDRDGLYGSEGRDYPDNAQRFAVLSRAALEYARVKGERPSVLHAHDWQAGLVPVYQKTHFANDPVLGGVPCVFTIHNLAFQGVFPSHVLPSLGLGRELLNMEALEFWGHISFLKGGVNFSEKITTVSPTYAREILTPDFGFGMQGVIARRAGDLIGIINGIDTERWNPATDAFVPAHFTADKLAGKRDAKRALLELVGLSSDEVVLSRPAIGVISRLTDQKGFDLIGAAAEHLMALDATWVMLGSGELHYEQLFRSMAARHPDRVSATIGFDERLAHFIEAGADTFLMPSRYEPCGLNQLYSLRYGTLPIVRATGGLEDTVVDAAEAGGNGFKFHDYTPGALIAAVTRALAVYEDRSTWIRLQYSAMQVDPSWDVSARDYVKVYREVINGIR
ncbi:MAG: glycogen synthase GlgA [Acidobacteria bacterium]|nr:glycogen synthase GlgA [Acidobacteriota bacterium]